MEDSSGTEPRPNSRSVGPTDGPTLTGSEREACARMCESRASSLHANGLHFAAFEALKCAEAIRRSAM